MLDQVLQARVDQQVAALMGAIRAAVSGNTGLSQGQTALAVVQVLQNAAPQNQNPGGGQSQGQPPTGQTPTGQNTGAQTSSPSGGAQTPQASQAAAQNSAVQNQAITQAAAQALVNQVKAQTAASMAAAVANATTAVKSSQAAPANLLPGTAAAPSAPVSSATTTPNPISATAATPSSTQTASLSASHAAAQNVNARNSAITVSTLSQLLATTPNPTPVKVSIPQTGQTVELPQLRPLPAGTQITLRQTANQQVDILKVQLPVSQQANTQQTAAATQNLQVSSQKAALQQTVMTALREALPVQQPITETLGRIQSLLPQLSATLQNQPAMQQALQTLNSATLKLSPQTPPSGEAVKQSIQRSGVFHEAVMMQALQQAAMPQTAAIAPVGDDLKGAFFQIFRQLTRGGQPSEGGTQERGNASRGGAEAAAEGKQTTQQNQLMRSLQEGLARIRSNQLQSTPAARGTEQAGATTGIQTDLPISLNGQLTEVKVKINQEIWPEDQQPEPGEVYQKRWVINLSFSPPELGKLHARLFYQEEKLATHIWVEQDEQLPAVSQQLQALKQRLSALGIQIEEIRCQTGSPKENQNNSVLNLKA